jgi:hypothetical protein
MYLEEIANHKNIRKIYVPGRTPPQSSVCCEYVNIKFHKIKQCVTIRRDVVRWGNAELGILN